MILLSGSRTDGAMTGRRPASFLNVSKFIVILIQLSEFSHGVLFTNENGAVTPSDPFKFLGETLILYCNITNDDLTGDLYFEREKGQEKEEIDRSNVEILTTKSVRLRLPNVDLEDDGTYTCHLRTYNKPKYIGHQVVKVDYKPSPIYNVSCRVMNWESMTCNWTLGVAYQHLDDLDVKLVWTVDGKQEMCPHMASNKSSCTWSSKEYLHNHKYFMRLIVRNLKRKESMALSPQFNVETRLYVEPAPVNNFMATVENSRCIALSWQHSSRPERDKVFIIQYKSSPTTQWENFSLNPEARKKMNTTVCGLQPNTDYTFRIKVMPYPEFPSEATQRNGFSSPWKTVSAKTEEDIPEAAPLICPSCFFERLSGNDTQSPVVTIYWKDIPSVKRNGRIIGYRIALANKTNFSPVMDVSVSQKMKYFADVPLPSKDMEYTLTVKGRTRKGYSKHLSQIIIPSKTSRPTAPDNFLVQKEKNKQGQDVYYLLWDDDKAAELTKKKTVIVWCFGTIPDFICKGDIHWIPLPAGTKNHIFMPEAEDEARGNLIFGIAREEVYGHNKTNSSGIQWASCIYHKTGKSPSPPHILEVTYVPQISGLSVTWEKNDCPKDLVYITRYGISLCQTEDEKTCVDKSPKLKRFANNSDARVEFPNLEAHVKYMAHVWAESESNSGDGKTSAPMIGLVEEIQAKEKTNKKAIIIIVVLVVVLLLILLFCICGACRYIKARRKRLPSWNADIPEYLVPNMHVQSRPLPEVPREDPQYGANACMKNPGSDSENQRNPPWMPCNGINTTKLNPYKPPLCFKTESTLGDETACQPLIPYQNNYETNIGMFPPPKAKRERCEAVEVDAYEIAVPCTGATSSVETFRQSAPQEPITDCLTSFSSGVSSGDSSYIPNHASSHTSTTDMPMSEVCIPPSESPPLNVAPPPPSLSAGNSLPFDQMNEQHSESPPSSSHRHSFPSDQSLSLNTENVPIRHPKTNSDDSDPSIVIMLPSCIVSYPNTKITHLAHNPRGNPLHGDCSKLIPSEPSRSSDGHSDTSDSSVSNEYSRFAPFEPPGHFVHTASKNSTSLDFYVPNGYMYPSDAPCDISQLPNGYSRVAPPDMSHFPEKSNFYPGFVPCDSCDYPEISDDYSTIAPCDKAPICQTPNGFPRIIDIHAMPSNGPSLPNGYLKCISVPNRSGVNFNDLDLPPPPPYPPPCSETFL